VDKPPEAQFSGTSVDVRARLTHALGELRRGAEAGPVLEAVQEESEQSGTEAALAAAYAELLDSAAVGALPSAARLELYLQAAWLCGQHDALEAATLEAASLALDVAPADERALALAEPLLLEAEQYGELANRYAVAASGAGNEARGRQLLEHAIHLLAPIPAAAPAMLGLNDRLQQLAELRETDEALLAIAGSGSARERQAAFVKLGERWLADGCAREGLEKLGTLPSELEGDAALDVLERLCDQAEDKQRLEQTLLRRVAHEKAELGRARALEKLARFQHEWQGDKGAATETLMSAAHSYQAANEPDDAERCYERLLDLTPEHADAAASLMLLRARTGDFAGVAEAFGVVLRTEGDNRRPSELLLSVAADAERVGAADEFAELADNVQWRLSGEDRELSGRLLRASARLFACAMRHDEAAELYRRMIADRPSSEDLDAYQALIDSHPGSEWRRNQQRWLFEWQENHSSDRPTILLSWARFEEHELGDPEAAMNVLERAAELAPDRPEVWENLARLRLADGDGAGGLRAAGELRRLGRDVDESLLSLLLEQEPGTRWALDRVKLSLSAEGRWPELFELYERAIDATADQRERADLLDEAAIAARDVAQDRPRALKYWEQYSQLVPHDPRVDLALERLYDQAGEKLGLIHHLQRRRQAVRDEARGALSRRIAQLALELGDLPLALDAIEELAAPPSEEGAELLEALLEQAQTRAEREHEAHAAARRAAQLLRASYAASKRPAELVRVLRAELSLNLEDKERRSLLAELSRVCEKELADLDGAFAAERELFLCSQSERDRKRLEKLAKKLGRFRELAQCYADAALAQPDLDERRALFRRAADVARARLQDGMLALSLYRQLFEQEPARAVELYEPLREDLPTGSEAFEALCALLQETSRYHELAQVLARECEQSPSAELQARLGWLQAQKLGDPRAAIATFLQAGDPRAAAAVFLASVAPFGDEPGSAVELANRLAKLGEVESALQVLRHQLGAYEQRYCSERKLVQLELVRVLEDSGAEQQASAELSEAARRYPTDADVQRACASSAVKRKDWERAEQCYRTLLLLLLGSGAATTNMCRATVYVELAVLKEQRLQPAEAAELIESAFEAALDNARELTALAQGLVEHEKWQPAERAVGELLKLANDLPTAARALAGVARLTLGGRKASEELIRTATQAARDAASRFAELTDPGEVSGLLLACMSLIPLEQARQLLRDEVARLLPADLLLARLELSRRLLEAGEPSQRDEAFAELAQLVQLPQAPLTAWQLLLTEAIARSDAELALSAYDQLARAGAPPEAAVAGNLCRLCAKAGKPDRAAAFLRLEADRERQPLKRAALLVEAAELLLGAGQSSVARALAEEARALDLSSAEPVLLLAKLALASGARELALAMLTAHAESKERRRSKGLARVLRLAADLRLERDELAEALALLAEAHQLDKTDLDTALLLGLLAIDLDRLETAASALRVLIAQRELGTREGARAHSLNLAQGYFQLARIEQHHGKKTNAKRMALRALEEDPGLSLAQQLLGELSHA
jgi:tetratricopeptide (TPR) repeat protein